MTILRNDIALIEVPFTDLSQTKVRPVVVLSEISHRNDIVCCFITSNPKSRGILIDKIHTTHGNLFKESFVEPTKIFTLAVPKIIKKIDSISNVLEAQIKFALIQSLT
jgi:mRNA interferase MazF